MIGEQKNLLFTVRLHNGLLQLRHSVMTCLAAIKETKFTPSWGETRLYNMVRDRGDWCISRQRVWGVPIPVFYAENGESIITDETIAHVSELFREHGSNIWFEREAKEFCQKVLLMKAVRMEYSQKKRILWMFGLIRVPRIKACLKREIILLIRLICTWKDLISTVDGLTHPYDKRCD